MKLELAVDYTAFSTQIHCAAKYWVLTAGVVRDTGLGSGSGTGVRARGHIYNFRFWIFFWLRFGFGFGFWFRFGWGCTVQRRSACRTGPQQCMCTGLRTREMGLIQRVLVLLAHASSRCHVSAVGCGAGATAEAWGCKAANLALRSWISACSASTR